MRHIVINEPKDCCGCGACAQICPKSCILLEEDSRGFLYPNVNTEICIECGKCVKSCPIQNTKGETIPLKCFVAQRKTASDTEDSTTIGAFYLLAKNIIDSGGVVFGARYNDEFSSVYHSFVKTMDELSKFQKSKYIQSVTGNCYNDCLHYLNQGVVVLYSGTPCQIAGLKNYLNKEYENLITVDLICHGVPSAKIWTEYFTTYIEPKTPSNSKVVNVNFRDNRCGWRQSGLSVSYITDDNIKGSFYEKHDKSLFFKAFYGNVFLRESCYDCPMKMGRSHSDITLGDFRNINKINKIFREDDSTATILANTKRGKELIESLNLSISEISFSNVLMSNPELYNSNIAPAQKNIFWQRYANEGISCLPNVIKSIYKTKSQTILYYCKQIIAILINYHKR